MTTVEWILTIEIIVLTIVISLLLVLLLGRKKQDTSARNRGQRTEYVPYPVYPEYYNGQPGAYPARRDIHSTACPPYAAYPDSRTAFYSQYNNPQLNNGNPGSQPVYANPRPTAYSAYSNAQNGMYSNYGNFYAGGYPVYGNTRPGEYPAYSVPSAYGQPYPGKGVEQIPSRPPKTVMPGNAGTGYRVTGKKIYVDPGLAAPEIGSETTFVIPDPRERDSRNSRGRTGKKDAGASTDSRKTRKKTSDNTGLKGNASGNAAVQNMNLERKSLSPRWRVDFMEMSSGRRITRDFSERLVVGRQMPSNMDSGKLYLSMDATVSRFQFCLYVTKNGVMLENLSKVNITRKNGYPVWKPVRLEEGDILELGRMRYMVKGIGPAA